MALIRTQGLAALRRDLRRLDAGMAKALNSQLRGLGKEVQTKVRGSTDDPHRTGTLRRSVKVSVARKGVSLYSRLPQAPVWQWGGSIAPRGTPIQIPRTEFVTREVDAASARVESELAAIFDALTALRL